MKAMSAVLALFMFLPGRPLCGDEPGVLSVTLEEAKARAENTSSELRSLGLQMLAQEYAFGLGARAFFPTVSVGFTRSDSVTALAPGDSSKKTVTLSLHQPLFDGGRALFRRRVQKLDLILQRYDYRKKREELLDRTWALFHQILLSGEKRRLQDEFHALALQQLAIARKELELGAITEIDCVDAELQVKNLEAEMRKTKLDEETLLYQFRSLCGLSPSRPIALEGKIDFSHVGTALNPRPEFWLGVALERNMEYRKLAFEGVKSREEYKIAQVAWVPTVGADLTFSLAGEGLPLSEPGFAFKLTFQFPFNEAPTKASLNASSTSIGQRATTADMSADLFPSLNYLSDQRLALLKVQMTNLEVEGAEETLRFNIGQFLENYAAEVESLALRKETLRLLDRKQRVTREQLGVGEIKRIDYLRAQNDYFNQEIAIRESIYRLIQLERGFEQLLGLEPGELALFRDERG